MYSQGIEVRHAKDSMKMDYRLTIDTIKMKYCDCFPSCPSELIHSPSRFHASFVFMLASIENSYYGFEIFGAVTFPMYV